jgi:hypothetical protein
VISARESARCLTAMLSGFVEKPTQIAQISQLSAETAKAAVTRTHVVHRFRLMLFLDVVLEFSS